MTRRSVLSLGASAAAILTSTDGGLVARASYGLVLHPRSVLSRGDDLERALDALAQTRVVDRMLVPLGGGAGSLGVLYLGFERPRE